MQKKSTERFDIAVETILRHEGFLSLDKRDPGGATKYGISLRYLKATGHDVNLDGKIDITDIMSLTRDDAKFIYKKYWWDKYHYGLIDDIKLITKIFDLAVNMGAIEAHKLVQRAINSLRDEFGHLIKIVSIDGIIGKNTFNAINDLILADDSQSLIKAINNEAINFYEKLVQDKPNLKVYLKGWLNRVNDEN